MWFSIIVYQSISYLNPFPFKYYFSNLGSRWILERFIMIYHYRAEQCHIGPARGHKGCLKKGLIIGCLISWQPCIRFLNRFFTWKLRSICKFWIQNISVQYYGAEKFKKQNAVMKQINSYSYCLIVASKSQNLRQAPQTGPRRALIAPKLLLLGLVTQTDLKML